MIDKPEEDPSRTITLIILLDQVARNIFRESESRVVFTVFDKIALDLSLSSLFPHTYRAAKAAGFMNKMILSSNEGVNNGDEKREVPWYEAGNINLHEDDLKPGGGGLDEHPSIRHRLGYRMWLYSPLMHSESLKIHGWVDKRYRAMIADMDSLTDQSSSVSQGPFVT